MDKIYSAKDIKIVPIKATDANVLCKKIHYSGKVVPNSQLHFGVFLEGVLEGVMQFGPSMDKRKMLGLVSGTSWNGFIELNRMAFSDKLPRNSESRAISIALKIIKKNYPHIEWVVSFSDATQCGDGTIYRAAGFILTGLKKNQTIRVLPDGEITTRMTMYHDADKMAKMWHLSKALVGFQLRYIYFLNSDARKRLTVKELPYSTIESYGAGMYKGKKRVGSRDNAASGFQSEEGGAIPTPTLQTT